MTSSPIRKIAAIFLAYVAFCMTVAVPAQAQSITLSDPNCTSFALGGTPPNQTLTCVPIGSPGTPTPPTGCQIASNPVSLTGTGSVQLTATCGGGTPTKYSWSASPPVTFTSGATTTGNSNGALITQTTAFTAVASNASPVSSTATTSVQVGGKGGGTGPISCADKGFTTTQYYDWDWTQTGLTIYTDISSSNARNPQGPIGPNGIVVIALTPTATAFGVTGSVTIAPYPGDVSGTTRTMTISTAACDFTPPFPWTRTGYDVGIQFTVGDFIPRLFPPLVAGTQYYINIATRDAAGVSTCASGGRACDMVIKANKP